MLIDRGVPVALATDVNPGGGFSPSMPFAMALGCFSMNMTLEESLIAATLNAAWSLDRADAIGSSNLKLMDAVIVRGELTELLRIGAAAIERHQAHEPLVARNWPGRLRWSRELFGAFAH